MTDSGYKLFRVPLLAVALLALSATSAPAKVIQEQTLTATEYVQRWVSTDRGRGAVAVHVSVDGQELQQRFLGPCAATYQGAGIFVSLRLRRCAEAARVSQPFVLKYVSVEGIQRFRVRLSASG
jgi:hypothetical protein